MSRTGAAASLLVFGVYLIGRFETLWTALLGAVMLAVAVAVALITASGLPR